jgi:hypothetical protein
VDETFVHPSLVTTGGGKLLALAIFTPHSVNAVGAPDFKMHTILADNKLIKFQIFDSLPQRYQHPRPKYRSAEVIIVLYDVTSGVSSGNVKHWLSEIDRYAYEEAFKIVVGTKNDLVAHKVVNPLVKELCDELEVRLIETSAKTGARVNEVFLEAARLCYPRHQHLRGLGPPEVVLRLQCWPKASYELLRTLDISHNNLRQLPQELMRCVHLDSLDVSHNELRDVPVSLFQLRRLRDVDLKHNPLPAELLYLNMNDLTSAVVLRLCRRTVYCMLLIRKFRRSVFDNLNHDVLLIVCRDVWSTRHDSALWLRNVRGMQQQEEGGEAASRSAIVSPDSSAAKCTVQ